MPGGRCSTNRQPINGGGQGRGGDMAESSRPSAINVSLNNQMPKSRSADVSPASARIVDMVRKTANESADGSGFEAAPSDALTAKLLFSEEDSLSPLCARHGASITDGDNVSTSSSHDSDGGTESRDEESSESTEGHERRDSGVGSSLTRSSRYV